MGAAESTTVWHNTPINYSSQTDNDAVQFYKKQDPLVPNETQEIIAKKLWMKTLSLRQNGHYLTEDIFKLIFLNENYYIFI